MKIDKEQYVIYELKTGSKIIKVKILTSCSFKEMQDLNHASFRSCKLI